MAYTKCTIIIMFSQETPKPDVTSGKMMNSISCATQQMPPQSNTYNIPPLMPPPSVQPSPYLSLTLPHSSHQMPPPSTPFTPTLCHPHNKTQQVYQYQQIIQAQQGRQLQATGQQQMLNQSQYPQNYLQMSPQSGGQCLLSPHHLPQHNNPSVMTRYTTLQPGRGQTRTGLNQLLHLIQQQHNLPPILRPQEWFTSI